MTYTLPKFENQYYGNSIMVVGCGGTGGFVAEGLCRLLVDKKFNIYLVDHDKVEEHNLGRQNFYPQDLGRFKAQVLAERLSSLYQREIDYITSPIEQMKWKDRGRLTIGCVDNADARDVLQYAGTATCFYNRKDYSYEHRGGWYIDAGNGEHSGQVLIGNAFISGLGRSFNEFGRCYKLPLPQLQQPSLLVPETKPREARDCAERVAADEQSPVINQMMAALVLQFVHRLIKGELTWMGAYVDLESGSMNTVPADPDVVSRMTGLSLKHLVYHSRPVKERVQVRV